MNNSATKILLSPLFLISLGLLLLNDFVLKSHFHNFLTGKISDFAGLFVFSLFFIAFFPKRKLFILVSNAIFFVFWKSPYSQNFIDLWNSFGLLRIERIVDFTDLFALSVLPFSYFYGKKCLSKDIPQLPFRQVAANCIILISLFAFIATSLSDEYNFHINKKYELNLTKAQFEDLLRQDEKVESFEIQLETEMFPTNQYPNLKLDPKSSFAHFNLNYKICDTAQPRVYIWIKDLGNKIVIENSSIWLRCQAFNDRNTNTAIKEYEPIIKSIFELEIIDKLKQSPSQ